MITPAEPEAHPTSDQAEQVAAHGNPADQPLAERAANRSHRPRSQAFRDFIAAGWTQQQRAAVPQARVAAHAARRRAVIGRMFPGERLVIPSGGLQTRSNDTDYRFRPHSAFAHLTGLGTDREPDAVLVLHPRTVEDGRSHQAVLYFRPRAGRDTEEFYADARYGELWVGARPTLDEVSAELGIACRHIEELHDALAKDVGPDGIGLRVVPAAAPDVAAAVDQVRSEQGQPATEMTAPELDDALAQALSELRLIKDAWEIEQMRLAIQVTVEGFAEIVANLGAAVSHPRGERVIETTFESHARQCGNGVGYDTIAAAGAHACTLHWIRNNGPVRPGDLVLIDAGAEVDSLYTADLTRTLPAGGQYSHPQRQVYDLVLAAADAAFAAAVPGAVFRDVHNAAMQVLARGLEQWGLLPVPATESLDEQAGGQHRRWMVHGTSHHLGIDVHDCAQARREMYLDATLEPGMVFTIEPGLYFMPDDELVPAQLRGIGVRIEDDVLVTEDGCENLSAALPRTAEDVQQWMADQRLLRRR